VKGTGTARAEIEELYSSEGPRLWRALLVYTRDPEVASDSVSEAFV
jgi:DNA-directed RNA polymerase specialized sigma24 family protein